MNSLSPNRFRTCIKSSTVQGWISLDSGSVLIGGRGGMHLVINSNWILTTMSLREAERFDNWKWSCRNFNSGGWDLKHVLLVGSFRFTAAVEQAAQAPARRPFNEVISA